MVSISLAAVIYSLIIVLSREANGQRSGRIVRMQNHPNCFCTNRFSPVCGNDRVTYYNRCHLDCLAEHTYNMNEGAQRVRIEKFGYCESQVEGKRISNGNESRLPSSSHYSDSIMCARKK